MPRFGDRRATRIGLLGGSFNPAHDGHRHVADLARRLLGLDAVWLLVSPGNPLKDARSMAPLPARLASARAVGDGRRVVATAIEAAWGTTYTVDTLLELRRRFPRAKFVWLMGADILAQLPRWKHWRKLTRIVPFAVLPRPGYSRPALAGRAAHALARWRLPSRAAHRLADAELPAWCFLSAPQNPASATAIRAARPIRKESRHRPQAPGRADPSRLAELAKTPRERPAEPVRAAHSGAVSGKEAARARDAPQEGRRGGRSGRADGKAAPRPACAKEVANP